MLHVKNVVLRTSAYSGVFLIDVLFCLSLEFCILPFCRHIIYFYSLFSFAALYKYYTVQYNHSVILQYSRGRAALLLHGLHGALQ